MTNKPAILVLADGTIYEGLSVGASGDCVGELVFNTSMTGYQEILSDPSYAKQIVTLTAPHIGNTGCNIEDMESSQVWASGLVMRDCSRLCSNYRADISFVDWLKAKNVVAIAEVDTRGITLKLREHGALGACISTDVNNPEKALAKARGFAGFKEIDLAAEVSRSAQETWSEGQGKWANSPTPPKFHVVAYDFGVKHSILRILHDLGCRISVVPAKTSAKEVLALSPDGVFLSNGPGDPAVCEVAIQATKEFLDREIPLFGICLGFQILALACGAETKKMKFGHHGANHPVMEKKGRVLITSQNHGFSVDEDTLPDCFEVTHYSLFDMSLQGIRHKTKPAFGFQGHPEANPGPHDVLGLFQQFLKLMQVDHE